MPNSPKLSKRAALRFTLPGKKISFMANGQLGEATLANISSRGCAVTGSTDEVSQNDSILIILELIDFEKPLELKARIVRSKEGTFCAEFKELKDDFIKDFPKYLANERRNSLKEEKFGLGT